MHVYEIGDTALITKKIVDESGAVITPDDGVLLTVTTGTTVVFSNAAMSYNSGLQQWEYSYTIPVDAILDVYSGIVTYQLDSSNVNDIIEQFQVGNLYLSVAELRAMKL